MIIFLERNACNIVLYSDTYVVKGYNGYIIRIDPDFKSNLATLNDYAARCSVVVEVTRAFEKVCIFSIFFSHKIFKGQSIEGRIDNFAVGHAIEFNLNTPSGWCNGWCLAHQTNAHAKCFTDKVFLSTSKIYKSRKIWKTPSFF